jgi:hypothetical protein
MMPHQKPLEKIRIFIPIFLSWCIKKKFLKWIYIYIYTIYYYDYNKLSTLLLINCILNMIYQIIRLTLSQVYV